MSYCKQEGKDKIIFMTEEDSNVPSSIKLPDDEEPVGLVKEDGSLNWSCPCLGGMATGPCGVEFRDAFTCFHYSEADPKGSDCLETFRTMSKCMGDYPGVYGSGEDNVMNVQEEGEDVMNVQEEGEDNESMSSVHDGTVSKLDSYSESGSSAQNGTSQSSSSETSDSNVLALVKRVVDRDSLRDAIQSSFLTSVRQHARRLEGGVATIRRAVSKLRGKSLVFVERPLLTPSICAKRFERCQSLMNDLKSAPPGRMIIFSDEKTWTVDQVRNIEAKACCVRYLNITAFKASVDREWMTMNAL
ncbi:CHCH protein [Trinorchestia longiramus]|nr:CHCH protein [Trinorchestia longiramus]